MKSFDLAEVLALPELPAYLARVQAKLEQVAGSDNSLLTEPLHRILQPRGKRLRPALVFAVASLREPKITEKVVTAGAAIELLHIASLIHDDIIDHAEARWNIPTIHAKEGVPSAILSGDYLFAVACEQAAIISPEAGQILAKAFAELCRGQALEIADDHNLTRTEGAYFAAIKGKTAALLSAACRLGALCGGFSEREIEDFADYGEAFGMSFQLIDDVLDFIADPKLFGKPTGNDVHEGNYTLPLILALKSSKADEVKTCLAKTPENLPDLLHKLGTIDQTIQAGQSYNHQATNPLKNLKTPLAMLPTNYTNWALTLSR